MPAANPVEWRRRRPLHKRKEEPVPQYKEAGNESHAESQETDDFRITVIQFLVEPGSIVISEYHSNINKIAINEFEFR